MRRVFEAIFSFLQLLIFMYYSINERFVDFCLRIDKYKPFILQISYSRYIGKYKMTK